MKRILLHNWKIKLTCLLLAFVVWMVIRHGFVNDAPAERWTPAAEHLVK